MDNYAHAMEVIEKNYMKDRSRAARIRNNALNKKREKMRTANYQRSADKYKKIMRKKGIGLAHKYKGQTMPTQLCNNSRCSKGWVAAFGGGETFKTAYIWAAT